MPARTRIVARVDRKLSMPPGRRAPLPLDAAASSIAFTSSSVRAGGTARRQQENGFSPPKLRTSETRGRRDEERKDQDSLMSPAARYLSILSLLVLELPDRKSRNERNKKRSVSKLHTTLWQKGGSSHVTTTAPLALPQARRTCSGATSRRSAMRFKGASTGPPGSRVKGLLSSKFTPVSV